MSDVGIPLAEALVKVRLVTDKTDIKSNINKTTEDATKAWRKQMAYYGQQARAFSIIGNTLNRVSGLILKAFLAPSIALGALGIRKYMQTTDAGAEKLRHSLLSLRNAWDQFLARVGKAISTSPIFQKTLERIKNLLNSLDNKKILQWLEAAKWAAIFYVITKITGEIFLWASYFDRIKKAALFIAGANVFGGAAGGAGGAVAGATGKAGIVGVEKAIAGAGTKQAIGLAAGGALAGVGGGGTFAWLRNIFKKRETLQEEVLNMLKKDIPGLKEEKYALLTKHSRILHGGKQLTLEEAAKAGLTLNKTLEPSSKIVATTSSAFSKFTAVFPKLLGVLKIFGKLSGIITLIFAAFDFLKGFFKGLGRYSETLKAPIDFFKKTFLLLWNLLTGVFDILSGFLQTLGKILGIKIGSEIAAIYHLVSGHPLEALRDVYVGIKEQFVAFWDWMRSIPVKIGEPFGKWKTPLEEGDLWNKVSKIRKQQLGAFEMLNKPSISTTTFAGLSAAAQEMAWKDEEINTRKGLIEAQKAAKESTDKLTSAIDKNTITRTKVDVVTSSSPAKTSDTLFSAFANTPLDFTTGISGNKVIRATL